MPATAALDDKPFSPTWHGAFAFASAWALSEWLRGYVFTGFPWLASGYAQVDGPLAGFAPVAGVYGVGWMLALVAALIVQALVRVREPADARKGASRMARVVACGCVAVALIAAGMLLPLVAWTLPANAPLTVRLLQGNVKQEMKFEEAGMVAAINEYQQMITAKPADLIVTPETAIPVLVAGVAGAVCARPFASSSDTTGIVDPVRRDWRHHHAGRPAWSTIRIACSASRRVRMSSTATTSTIWCRSANSCRGASAGS